ncbi:MAG TPA: alpha/beta hydrolase [Bacillota bacterium]|nr:alpha/beta hydrolase [Bacillota bacterium]
MKAEHFTFSNEKGQDIYVYRWLPKKDCRIKGVLQISHGMAEHAGRYERLADFLTQHGYIIYANDQRGHGKTAGHIDNVGYIGEDGFSGMVLDMKQLTDIIKMEYPGMPLIVLGHSMGSFLTQRYIQRWGQGIEGAILSGSNGERGLDIKLAIGIARLQAFLLGKRKRSRLLKFLTFSVYNSAFRPARTPFDWLSRDKDEVDEYIADKYCGGVYTTSFFLDFFRLLDKLYDREAAGRIPKDLSLNIISGAMDPVGGQGKGVRKLIDFYKGLGLNNVSSKLYPGARHELLNEVNRDEVMEDILLWLVGKTKG